MGTTQHFALFEHVTGYALFRIKEFDEITRSFTAHVNAFIKPVAFLHFKSIEEAVENINCVSEGVVSELLKQFIRSNVPQKSSVLGVHDQVLGKAILACGFGFECVWHGAFREVLRVIRQNFTRLTKSLITQPGNAFALSVGQQTRPLSKTGAEEQVPGRVAESRARLVVGLTRARLQLNLTQHLADTAVVRALTLIDELDADLTRSTARLRSCYTTHFPEVCRNSSVAGCPSLSDVQLIHLIAHCPQRAHLLTNEHIDELKQIDVMRPVLDAVVRVAEDSIGSELSPEDATQLKAFAGKLLRTMETRNHYAQILARRVETLVPNLNSLLQSTLPRDAPVDGASTMRLGDSLSPALVAARLINNAGSLTRLANMPASRVLSLGASKALFRKSGAVAANASGLFGQVVRATTSSNTESKTSASNSSSSAGNLTAAQLKAVSADRIQPDTIRRKTARLLAAKSSLACRADCFRYHNPPDTESAEIQWVEDPRLKSGAFGEELGRDVHHQLRVWAETNGVHADRTEEQLKAQRDRRKKYRKAKRKAWLVRKLTRSATGGVPSTAQTTGHTYERKIESKTAPAPVVPQSQSLSDSEGSSSDGANVAESMLVDNDSDSEQDRPAKRKKISTPLKTSSSTANPCVLRSTTGSAKRSLRIKSKQSISVTG